MIRMTRLTSAPFSEAMPGRRLEISGDFTASDSEMRGILFNLIDVIGEVRREYPYEEVSTGLSEVPL